MILSRRSMDIEQARCGTSDQQQVLCYRHDFNCNCIPGPTVAGTTSRLMSVMDTGLLRRWLVGAPAAERRIEQQNTEKRFAFIFECRRNLMPECRCLLIVCVQRVEIRSVLEGNGHQRAPRKPAQESPEQRSDARVQTQNTLTSLCILLSGRPGPPGLGDRQGGEF